MTDMTAAELAPHARKAFRGERRIWLVLGGLLLVLGLPLVAIPLLATSLAEAMPLTMIGLLAAVLPGAFMVRFGSRSMDVHPLVVALEKHPEQIREVSFAYMEGFRGYRRIAEVTVGERLWSFPVSSA